MHGADTLRRDVASLLSCLGQHTFICFLSMKWAWECPICFTRLITKIKYVASNKYTDEEYYKSFSMQYLRFSLDDSLNQNCCPELVGLISILHFLVCTRCKFLEDGDCLFFFFLSLYTKALAKCLTRSKAGNKSLNEWMWKGVGCSAYTQTLELGWARVLLSFNSCVTVGKLFTVIRP